MRKGERVRNETSKRTVVGGDRLTSSPRCGTWWTNAWLAGRGKGEEMGVARAVGGCSCGATAKQQLARVTLARCFTVLPWTTKEAARARIVSVYYLAKFCYIRMPSASVLKEHEKLYMD